MSELSLEEQRALTYALTDWRFVNSAPWWNMYDSGDREVKYQGHAIHGAAIDRHQAWVTGELR